MVLAAESSGQRRTFSGVLSAAETTRLSFAVSGKLLEVPLREGEAFALGQMVARLDPSDIEREIASATARVAAARGRLEQAEQEFTRQESLYERGLVARAVFERVSAELTTARSEFDVATAELQGALVRLDRTLLIAPHDGVVTKRLARQYEEIVAGVAVYEIATTDTLQAEVLVPEQFIGGLAYDALVQVSIPALPGIEVTARIDEIAAESEAGNAFRVKARLDSLPPGARSGLTATVTFEIAGQSAAGLDLPLAALVFEQTRSAPIAGDTAAVFVFDAEKEIVSRRVVRIAGVTGNWVRVVEGLAAGERVVVAGVAFLQDGQRARLWTAPQ